MASQATLKALYKTATLVDQPIYPLGVVARYVRVPTITVRSWVVGRTYPTSTGKRLWEPLIEPADGVGDFLSFTNLTEIHVLSSLRRFHDIPMPKVRQAISDLRNVHGDRHPLANKRMRTDGMDLFLDEVRTLVKLDGTGQLAIRQVMVSYLKRIVHEGQHAVRLYPWIDEPDDAAPRLIAIDPRVAFGRPFLAGSGTPTAAVIDRFSAGETIAELAEDLSETSEGIEQAINLEQRRAA